MQNTSLSQECDFSLEYAHSQWLTPLTLGTQFLKAGDAEAAIAPLSEAIRISASYHPLYHFLESGLHTELGQTYLLSRDFDLALKHFERAIFLHHNNETAIAGKYAAEHQEANSQLPVYAAAESFIVPDQGETATSIHTLRNQGRLSKDVSLYLRAIEICEPTHQAYHKLAALPWVLRARAFSMLGQDELSKNDTRRGRDLDRTIDML